MLNNMPDSNNLQLPTNTSIPKRNGVIELIWAGIILAVLLVGAGAYYAGFVMNKKSSQTQTSPTPSESTAPVETVTPITDAGVTWLTKPEKLGNLQLLSYSSDSVNYYKVADLINGGQLIDAQIEEMGIATYLFKKDSAGIYYLVSENSPSRNEKELNQEKYSKNLIKIDQDTVYKSLLPPKTLTLQGAVTKAIFNYDQGQFFDVIMQNFEKSQIDNPSNKETIKKIGDTSYGDVYEDRSWHTSGYPEYQSNNPKIQRINYILKLADTSIIRYAVKKDFLADDGTLIATLTNKDFSSKKFNVGFGGGCGGPIDTAYNDSNLPGKLAQIGTASSGEPLYAITDANDDILKATYETYKSGRVEDKNLLSYESYASKKPVLIWKDPFGNYLIFMDKDYGTMAECGKPVIYLYPEETTSVSVKVGADVRISEPAYNLGWKVTASPDGSILNQDGQIYDSLYWEGTGNGFYPSITQGRIVSSKNIKVELQNDLTTLGLNKKESADFMNFWLPKMPETPYIRLTWLTTKEINTLAPLSVSPKPDTIARIFLDFQEQNSPTTNLIPQQLTGFERKGFTLVEWGGLLIGKQ